MEGGRLSLNQTVYNLRATVLCVSWMMVAEEFVWGAIRVILGSYPCDSEITNKSTTDRHKPCL